MIRNIMLVVALIFFSAFPLPVLALEVVVFVLLCIFTWVKLGLVSVLLYITYLV